MHNGKRISSSAAERAGYQQLEDVIGCKWSVSVLQSIARGVIRPGELERSIPGISTKVLSERLRKLSRYGLIVKTVFPEVPPHTEYRLTDDGHKLVAIISQIRELDRAMTGLDDSRNDAKR